MNQIELLEELENVAVFDNTSKDLAERIVSQMFQEVRKKVAQPTLQNYASFVLSYMKKSATTVPSVVCGAVLRHCSDGLASQALDALTDVATAAPTPQDRAAIFQLIFTLVERLVSSGKLQMNQIAIQNLITVMTANDAQPIAEALSLIAVAEVQHQAEAEVDQPMHYCQLIAAELFSALQAMHSAQALQLLKNVASCNLLTFVVSGASGGQFTNSQALSLMQQLVKFQLLHVHGTVLDGIFLSLVEDSEYISFEAVYCLFRAVQSNPYPSQAKLLSKIVNCLLGKPTENTQNQQVQDDDPVSQMLRNPIYNICDLGAIAVSTYQQLLQLGASSFDVQSGLFAVVSHVYQQDEIQFTTEQYQQFIQSLQKLFNMHSHSQRFVGCLRAAADQFCTEKQIALQPVFDILVATYQYHQEQSEPVQRVVEYFMQKLTFVQAFEQFHITIQQNMSLLPLVSKCCVRGSLSQFNALVIQQLLPNIIAADCEEHIKNALVQQAFQMIETCGAPDYAEYCSQNLSSLQQNTTKLITDYLKQNVANPLSLYVLRYFSKLIGHFSHRIKVNAAEIQHNAASIVNKISFKIYVQQYLIQTLVPALLNLVTNEHHEMVQYIQESLSGEINTIITQAADCLREQVSTQRFFESQEMFLWIDEEVRKQFIPQSPTFSAEKLLKQLGSNVVKRVTSFQNQSKIVKQETLELLSSLLASNSKILGDDTEKIIANICTQLLTNPTYEDIASKSFKLLGKFSMLNIDQAFEIFKHSPFANAKYRAIFLQFVEFTSPDQLSVMWQEIRSNYLAENAHSRRVSHQLLGKLITMLQGNGGFESYLDALLRECIDTELDNTQLALIEATTVMFGLGAQQRLQLTPEFIQQLIESKQPLPILPQLFTVLACRLIENLPMLIEGNPSLLRTVLNYIEIYCANADSATLTDVFDHHEQQMQMLFANINQLTRHRIQLKRILIAAGLCVGRTFMSDFMQRLDVSIYNDVLLQDEIRSLQFTEREKCVSQLLASSRNIFSRVNKIIRAVKPDSSPGRYEAAQYLLVHETVPRELLGQLKQRSHDDADVLRLEKVLTGQADNKDQEIDLMDAEVQQGAIPENEEDLLLQQVKLQKDQQKEQTYQNVLTELAKIRQRRLYKVDAAFSKTGKESINVRGGGDVANGINEPGATLPVVESKRLSRLERQNAQKLKEGMGVIFGKQKKALEKKVNIGKLGRMASRIIQGGKQKVKSLRKRAAAEALKKDGRTSSKDKK